MAFENSPKLGNSSKPERTFRGWVYKLRPALLILVAPLIILDLLFLVYKNNPERFTRPPGGLDGCLVRSNGAPVTATVWVDNISRPLYADGCFFFSALTPGKHTFRVQAVRGLVYSQTVVIPSNQAVALGNIQVEP